MRKRLLSLALALLLCAGMAGCSCKHEWLDATCTTPTTCAKCGEAAGNPLGHNWKDATCTQPEVCSVCGATNGQPLGHQWMPATCTASETCSVCGDTQGDPPVGHTLQEDGVCTVCGEAVGTPLTLGNYTQYLALSWSFQKIGVIKYGNNDYSPRAEYTISVTPDPHFTYHGVRIQYKRTTTSTRRWEDGSGSVELVESGLFSEEKGTLNSAIWATSGDDRWSYSSESSAKEIDRPNYRFTITGITGYILPKEADAQGSQGG